MVSSVFKKRYAQLDIHQREAVDAIEGPVMVVAGPGTGKTTILTLRIANILQKTDTPPDAILALTFTESGVSAMRTKLQELIGPSAYRVKIHTFHSFANEIIKTYPDKFPRIIGAEHMEELVQRRIMQDVIDSLKLEKLRPRNDPSYYVPHCISAIKELKRENIGTVEFEKRVRAQEKAVRAEPEQKHTSGRYKGEYKGAYLEQLEKVEKNKELVSVYESYEKILSAEHLYDFEDMLMEAVRAFEADKDLLLRIQEESQYILADEHQDANRAQNRLLELLSSFHADPNLFIVGDEKQAIFRFQGASLENFMYFKRLYPQAKLVVLAKNYRSHQTILDASHSLMAASPIFDATLHAPLSAGRDIPAQNISLVEVGGRDAERMFVAEAILKRLSAGARPTEIAVLIRENKDAEPLCRVLSASGIPVARFSDSDALSHTRIDAFYKLLTAIAEPQDEYLAPVLFFDFLGIDAHDAFLLITEARKSKTPLIAAMRASRSFSKFSRRFARWTSISKNEPLVEGFSIIVEESKFREGLLSRTDATELLALFEALLRSAERFAERNKRATIADFVVYIREAREHNIAVTATVAVPDGVAVMTAHRSKGLEFDTVFLLHANDGIWGGKRARASFTLPLYDASIATDEEDERRLFYVALTRAKKEALVLYSALGDDGKERLPSRFLLEMDQALITKSRAPKIAPHSRSIAASPKLLSDKAFLNKLFLERGLSVTHINNFLACPWRYFFVDLIRVPESQSQALLYGSAIHATLRAYFDAYARSEDMSIASALSVFEGYIRRTHLGEADFKTHLASGKKELKGYLSQKGFIRECKNEYRIAGIPFPISKGITVMLNGSLDKVEFVGADRVNVVDYKTGKPKSRNDIEGKTKNSDGNYKRQLVFYRLLLTKLGLWKMETGTLDFIKPDERGNYHREVFTVEDSEVAELEAVVRRVAEEILSLSFYDKGCGKKDCEFCRLSTLVR